MTIDERIGASSSENVSDAIRENLDKVKQFAEHEDAQRTRSQRFIEHVTVYLGRPSFLLAFVGCNVGWIVLDCSLHALGHSYFDVPPFPLLQGIVTFIGVLITIAVLTRQNRLARVEEARTHLELQINLLAEQKATKIITLLEELRRDLPNVQDRRDKHAETLQAATNPDAVLAVIRERNDAVG